MQEEKGGKWWRSQRWNEPRRAAIRGGSSHYSNADVVSRPEWVFVDVVDRLPQVAIQIDEGAPVVAGLGARAWRPENRTGLCRSACFAAIRSAQSCGVFATDRVVCTFDAGPKRRSS